MGEIMLEKIFTTILFIVGIFIYYLSLKFELPYSTANDLGPDFFPKILSVLLCVLSLVLLFRKSKAEDKNNQMEIKKSVLIVFCFGIYIVGIVYIGYLVATILFSLVILNFLKISNKKQKYLFSVFFPLVLYGLFTYLFKVVLPTGVLI